MPCVSTTPAAPATHCAGVKPIVESAVLSPSVRARTGDVCTVVQAIDVEGDIPRCREACRACPSLS